MTSSLARPADPASRYAGAVHRGKILAGPHVRAACERHFRDLARVGKKGFPYHYDDEKAERVLRFFRKHLKLDGGEAPIPFDPQGWQEFVLASLFGWVGADGFRRFNTAFVETGKGSGKSPLAAGIGIYMLTADEERRAEVYSAAVDKEQAGILFKDAVSMTKLSPAIDRQVVRSGGEGREFNIAFLKTGSYFRPISSESTGRGKSGYRPHCVLLDEIHEHPTNAMVEFMKAGIKNRRQPLIFMITNSGHDRTSVCYDYHEYGQKVAAGDLQDESFFTYICALDEDEDPFVNRRCWPKANPSLGVTIRKPYLEKQVTEAKGMPAKESIVRRLNFCQWVDAANPWIDGDLWRACLAEPEEFPADEDLADLPCSLALDLSGKRDLTALAAVWPREAGGYWARAWFWTPGDTLAERERTDRVPYLAWEKAGHIFAPEGRSIPYAVPAQFLAEMNGRMTLAALAFDPYRMEDFQRELDGVGMDSWIADWDAQSGEWVEKGKKSPGTGLMLRTHGQGFGGGASASSLWMPRSVTATEEAVLSGALQIRSNPVLTWNSASAVLVEDPAGNKKWDKRKSTGRIDGMVALSMAIGLADSAPVVEAGSVYETRGVLTF